MMDKPNFQFRRRQEKLDWKKLAALDVDQITRTVDYKALQESIRQITYCDATSEFDANTADPNLLKVFRMSQLIIEYLLQSQDFLANNLANAEKRLNSTLEELDGAQTRERRNQDEMRDLRKGLRAQASSTVMTMAGHQRCQICQKVFINTAYLQSHMMRRHNMLVNKQPSNQTLSTVTQEQSTQRNLEAELEQVRQRLLVAEQQLQDERRRAATLSSPPPTVKEEPMDMSPLPSQPTSSTTIPAADAPPSAGSGSGSGKGSLAGSGGSHGSGQGSAAGSHGSGQGSAAGSAGSRASGQGSAAGSAGSRGSGQGSGAGSAGSRGSDPARGSARGSAPGSVQESVPGSTRSSSGRMDERVTQLLEQQETEIRQLRAELERQRQLTVQTPLQNAVDYVNTVSEVGPEAASVQKDLEKQSRREVVALEGKMESQERYWQGKLSEMRRKHDVEVDCMRRQLQDKDRCAGNRGSSEYVALDSSPEESPRLLRYVHRHQSPSPGPDPGPAPVPPARNLGTGRPRPCISRPQRRSRSVSGCRRIKFDDDDCIAEEDEDGVPRGTLSQDALGRNAGVPSLREDLEDELNDRLMNLGIDPGTRRISSGTMMDKLQYISHGRRGPGFGNRRRQMDDDVNQRLAKFGGGLEKRPSRLATFAKDMLHRGADFSRSLISIGQRGRVPSSATIDAQLMQRAVAMGTVPPGGGPAPQRRAASHSPGGGRRDAGRAAGSGWRDPRRAGTFNNRYDYDDDGSDFGGSSRSRRDEPQPPFKFKPNASKHILERFTKRGSAKSSLIKSTTIHRVNSDEEWEDPAAAYDRLRSEKPPSGSATSAARRAGSTERQAAGSPAISHASSRTSGLRPDTGGTDAADGFVTPMTRPESQSSVGRRASASSAAALGGTGTSAGSLTSPGSPAGVGSLPTAASVSRGSVTSPGSPAGVGSLPTAASVSRGSVTSPGSPAGVGSLPTAASVSRGSMTSPGSLTSPGSPAGVGSLPTAASVSRGSVTSPGSPAGVGSLPRAASASRGSVSVPSGGALSPAAASQASVARRASSGGSIATPSSQGGSVPAVSKPSGFNDDETAGTASAEPSVTTGVEARPSGSANTLSTSQWNPSDGGADGAAATDTSATEDTADTSEDTGADTEDTDDTGGIPVLADAPSGGGIPEVD